MESTLCLETLTGLTPQSGLPGTARHHAVGLKEQTGSENCRLDPNMVARGIGQLKRRRKAPQDLVGLRQCSFRVAPVDATQSYPAYADARIATGAGVRSGSSGRSKSWAG